MTMVMGLPAGRLLVTLNCMPIWEKVMDCIHCSIWLPKSAWKGG